MENRAKKIVIITEKTIAEEVTGIIEDCGSTGYTITPADGKGSRGVRSSDRVANDTSANVRIEAIVSSTAQADEIAHKVSDKFFDNYSGIMYAMDVEILRPQKFQKP